MGVGVGGGWVGSAVTEFTFIDGDALSLSLSLSLSVSLYVDFRLMANSLSSLGDRRQP